jgi:hypothetical protein
MLVFLLCLLGPVMACGSFGSDGEDRQATADALEQLVIETATASVGDEESPEDILETAQAAATEAVATIEARGTEAADAVATARAAPTLSPVLPPGGELPPGTPGGPGGETPVFPAGTPSAELAAILQELALYGVDPAGGTFGGLHPPETIRLEGFQEFGITQGFGETPVRDFVTAVDVTWNTEFGASGCGFVLRSDSVEFEESSQYLAVALREEGGNVFFQTRLVGETPASELVEFDVETIDPAFQWVNNGTNRLAVVAQGETFSIYSNGTLVGTVTPLTALSEGLVTFLAVNDSGRTTCMFENGWLWVIE